MQIFWILLSYPGFKLYFTLRICLAWIIYKATRQQLNSKCGKVNFKILAVRYYY